MPDIHRSAVVFSEARLASDVSIGPGCVITGPVRLGAGVRLMGHNQLHGPIEIEEGTVLYPFATVGFEPQHRKAVAGFTGAGVRIGARGILREHTTVHASMSGTQPTRVGNDVHMMVGSHIGHDCVIGDRVTLANNACCGGHVLVGDDVRLGEGALVHQFCRIGRLAMMRGGTATNLDVPPFCVAPRTNRIAGPNHTGMRRAGLPREEITALRRAYRVALRRPLARPKAIEVLHELANGSQVIKELVDFIATTERGITPAITIGARGSRGGERTADLPC